MPEYEQLYPLMTKERDERRRQPPKPADAFNAFSQSTSLDQGTKKFAQPQQDLLNLIAEKRTR